MSSPNFPNFRQAMTWLHTWTGLVLGFVLIAAFFFGALSVFDREIDRWAIPETRFAAAENLDVVGADIEANLNEARKVLSRLKATR